MIVCFPYLDFIDSTTRSACIPVGSWVGTGIELVAKYLRYGGRT